MIIKEKAANECVHLFFGYQASSCPRPCKSTETKSKLVSKMSLNNKDEMRIRIKFKPTVTVTTTDFVKPSLGVFMSEVKSQIFGPKPGQLLFDCLNVRLVARWDSGLGLVLSRYFSGLPALSNHNKFPLKTFLLQAVQFIVNQLYPTLKVLCSRNGK